MDVLGLGDPRRGHHVVVQFGGWRQDATPARISDREGRQWVVEDITGHWIHPNRHGSGADKVGYGLEAERWRLVVDGPLPYGPGHGRQPVAIRTYFSALSQLVAGPGAGEGLTFESGLLPAGRTPAGYWTYDEDAVERLAFIGTAKALGVATGGRSATCSRCGTTEPASM